MPKTQPPNGETLPVLRGKCNAVHKALDGDIAEIKSNAKSTNNKLWTIILLLIANLGGFLFSQIAGCMPANTPRPPVVSQQIDTNVFHQPTQGAG